MGKYLNGINIYYSGKPINGIGANPASREQKEHKFTSDHALQQFSFRVTDKEGKSLTGDKKIHLATWNLLTQCRQFPNGIYNNPYKIANEPVSEYLARKHTQKDHIEKLITDTGAFSIKNDIVLLQEADFYYWPESSVKKFRVEFDKMLESKGYGKIVPDKNFQQIPIIYNKAKFEPLGDYKTPKGFEQYVYKTDVNGDQMHDRHGNPDYFVKYRAIDQNFRHKETSEKFQIINMHLDMDKDYNKVIHYYKNNVADNYHIIFGGDTNHVGYNQSTYSTSKINSLINSGKATNIEATDSGLTTKHHDKISGQTNLEKNYDGVVVNAAAGKKIQITIDASQSMEVDGKGSLKINGYIPGLDKNNLDVVYTLTGGLYFPSKYLSKFLEVTYERGDLNSSLYESVLFSASKEKARLEEKEHKSSHTSQKQIDREEHPFSSKEITEYLGLSAEKGEAIIDYMDGVNNTESGSGAAVHHAWEESGYGYGDYVSGDESNFDDY